MAVEKTFESLELPVAAGSPLELVRAQGNPNNLRSVQVLEGVAALEYLRKEWDELFERTPNARLTGSWSWSSLWWHHLGALDRGNGRPELVLFACRDTNSRLIAVMPCHYNPNRGQVGPKSAYPCGLRLLIPFGVLDHRDVYSLTEEPTYLLPDEHLGDVVDELGREALEFVRQKGLDGFMFEVDETDAISALKDLAASRKRSFMECTKTYEGSQVRTLPSDWSLLRKSLSKKMKDKISYSPRFIERSGQTWCTEIHRDGEKFDEALGEVFRLHQLRADLHTGKFHNNYFAHPHQAECLTALAKDLSDQGRAFVATFKIDEAMVAAQLFLEHDKEVIVTYSGFDPDFHQFSPLFVLLCEVLKDAIKRGIEQVNFLVSGEQYQTRWGATPISIRNRFIFVRRTPMSLLKFGAFVWARNRKRQPRNG